MCFFNSQEGEIRTKRETPVVSLKRSCVSEHRRHKERPQLCDFLVATEYDQHILFKLSTGVLHRLSQHVARRRKGRLLPRESFVPLAHSKQFNLQVLLTWGRRGCLSSVVRTLKLVITRSVDVRIGLQWCTLGRVTFLKEGVEVAIVNDGVVLRHHFGLDFRCLSESGRQVRRAALACNHCAKLGEGKCIKHISTIVFVPHKVHRLSRRGAELENNDTTVVGHGASGCVNVQRGVINLFLFKGSSDIYIFNFFVYRHISIKVL